MTDTEVFHYKTKIEFETKHDKMFFELILTPDSHMRLADDDDKEKYSSFLPQFVEFFKLIEPRVGLVISESDVKNLPMLKLNTGSIYDEILSPVHHAKADKFYIYRTFFCKNVFDTALLTIKKTP